MGLTKKNFYQKKYEIVTSWDDGGEHDMKIAHLLKKYKMSGTFYITLDYVGREGYLNWQDIKELVKMGFEIGSHTITHPQDLKKLYDEDLFVEIQNSKDMLETALGITVKSFCYPRGRHNDRVRRFVAEAGYVEARVTGKPGIITAKDKLTLPGTIHIYQRKEYEGKSIFEFAKQILNRLARDGNYCNIWGHSAEIQRDNNWNTLEEVLKYASQI